MKQSVDQAKQTNQVNGKQQGRQAPLRQWITLGVYLALTLALGFVESQLPPPPVPFPLRYGLSNIVSMHLLLNQRTKGAYIITVTKSIFRFFISGPLAGLLSLSGGLAALTLSYLILKVSKDKASYLAISIPAAVMHNLVQLAFVGLFIKQIGVKVLLIPLILFGILSGALTGIILYLAEPVLEKLERHEPREH